MRAYVALRRRRVHENFPPLHPRGAGRRVPRESTVERGEGGRRRKSPSCQTGCSSGWVGTAPRSSNTLVLSLVVGITSRRSRTNDQASEADRCSLPPPLSFQHAPEAHPHHFLHETTKQRKPRTHLKHLPNGLPLRIPHGAQFGASKSANGRTGEVACYLFWLLSLR